MNLQTLIQFIPILIIFGLPVIQRIAREIAKQRVERQRAMEVERRRESILRTGRAEGDSRAVAEARAPRADAPTRQAPNRPEPTRGGAQARGQGPVRREPPARRRGAKRARAAAQTSLPEPPPVPLIVPVPVRRAPEPRPESPRPIDWRQAIIMSEILAKPIAMRNDEDLAG